MSEATSNASGLPSKRVIVGRFLLSLLPLLVFVWILKKVDLPLVPNDEALRRIKPLGVCGYGAWFLIVLLVRGFRWRYLVQSFAPISYRSALTLTSMGNAAIVLLPMRSGEVVRPLLAKRRGLSAMATLSTIGAERIIDGLAVGLIVFVSLSLSPGHPQGLELLPLQFRDPTLVTRAARFALGGFSVALIGLLVFYFSQRYVRWIIDGTVGRISSKMADKLNGMLNKVASGLSFLTNRRLASAYLVSTVLYWALQITGIHLLLLACGFENVPFIESCAIFGVFALGFLLPSPPGFFGAFQTTFYAGLLLYYPMARVVQEGACVVFFAYVIQLGLTVLLGVLCYLWEYVFRNSNVTRPS